MRRAGAALFGAALIVAPATALPQAQLYRTVEDVMRDRAAIAKELAEPIARCVQRRDTNHDAFHGCIDWHSSVHGVLGLVIHGAITDSPRYDKLVASKLEPQLILREREFLKRDPGFEMPYGRAWFLRLAVEHERRFKSKALRDMADETAESLRAFVAKRRSDFLEGSYDSVSWALINLLDYALATNGGALADFARQYARSNLLRTGPGCAYRLEDGAFMSVCLQRTWLAAKTLSPPEFEIWNREFLRSTGIPKPVTRPASAHHHGLNFSRSWALAALQGRTGLADYDAALAAHMSAGYRPRSNWDGNYQTVAHWVAQFGMMALRLVGDDSTAAAPAVR